MKKNVEFHNVLVSLHTVTIVLYILRCILDQNLHQRAINSNTINRMYAQTRLYQHQVLLSACKDQRAANKRHH